MKRERETGSLFVVSPGAMGESTENQVKTGSSSEVGGSSSEVGAP